MILDDNAGSVQQLSRWINGKTTDEVYNIYKKWCEDMNIKVEANKAFTRQFSKLLPVYIIKKVVKFNSYQIDYGDKK